MQELLSTMNHYQDLLLPSAAGSIDVFHLKWSNCPAEDYNFCKGKEQYPTLAFEVVTNNKCEILRVAPIQFGTRNDWYIVKLDPSVCLIRNGWYRNIVWTHFDLYGNRF